MNELQVETKDDCAGCADCPDCFDAHGLHVRMTVDGRCRECGFTHPE